jgi:hypothetical protein
MYWPAVGATAASSLLLVVVLVALTPHRRHAPAVEEGAVALVAAESPRVEEPPAAEPPVSAAPAPVPADVPPTPEPQASAPPPNPPEVVEAPPPNRTEVAVVLPPGCQRYRTAVNFYDSPAEARKKALEDDKLVFVLHVAGNFEEPGFT